MKTLQQARKIISENGIELITRFEGFRSKPYLDPVGVATIGYGTTFYPDSGKKVLMTDKPITEETARYYLKLVCINFGNEIQKYITKGINQNQFDALVSFSYNVGVGAFKSSTLLKRINNNPNDPDIRRQFLRWINAGGKQLPGLVRRREAEADLYFS